MSRYPIPPSAHALTLSPHIEVWVGWDNPLTTLFGHVLNPEAPTDEGEIVFVCGQAYEALTTVDALAHVMAPWGRIPDALCRVLTAEVAARTPPTPLQQIIRQLYTYHH